MLRFFRTLRHRLLTENRFSKYLLYAVGEILLVVIGILIAISIDNWNTNRLDRLSETDYLERLTTDLARDTANYSWTYQSTLVKESALANLLTYLDNDEIKTLDSLSLLKILRQGRLLSFAHPRVVSSTFEELKNTGRFEQIQSASLRSAISDYYASREHAYMRIESKRVEPSFGAETDRFIPDLRRKGGRISYRADLVSFSDIIENIRRPDFKRIVMSEFNLAGFMKNIQKNGLEDSKHLLNEIRAELAKGEK